MAGAAGVVWIVVNPWVPRLALTGLFYMACGLSVTASYHRLFAHRTSRAAAAVWWGPARLRRGDAGVVELAPILAELDRSVHRGAAPVVSQKES